MNALRYLWFRIGARLWPCAMCGLRPRLNPRASAACKRCAPIIREVQAEHEARMARFHALIAADEGA